MAVVWGGVDVAVPRLERKTDRLTRTLLGLGLRASLESTEVASSSLLRLQFIK